MAKLAFQYVRQQQPESLLEFLVRRFRYHSALEWEDRIQNGHVTVNGRPARGTQLLETRDKILYERPPGPEPEVDGRYTVLYEDDALLAVSKSGNIPTSPSGKYWDNCLVHLLQRERNLPGLHAVHRLDRETSGINLFAKTKTAARQLGKDFQEGRVLKAYQAVVAPAFPRGECYVSAPLRDARMGAIRIRQEVHPLGRAAVTRFQWLAEGAAGSVVEVRPLTGRTHQIRVHAALLGHPIIGDKLYGQSEAEFLAWVKDGARSSTERHLLHASVLKFSHPERGIPISLEDMGSGAFQ